MSRVRDAFLSNGITFTRAEEKVVRLLLADYPTSGLGTATSLARRAGVSDPTVSRLMVKLGFGSYPDFQARLLSDVEASWHSPLHMMHVKRSEPPSSAATFFLNSVGTAVNRAATETSVSTYEKIARLVVEARAIHLLGGRFSRHVAGVFAEYLLQFRSGVRDLGFVSAQAFDALADMTRKDALIVFDYRRYQRDVVRYAEQVADRHVRIVLFTDGWLSPIADRADVVVVAPQEVASPYDTIAPAVAQVEAVVATMVATMSEAMRSRIEQLEKVRHDNEVTIDDAGVPAASNRSADPAGSRLGRQVKRRER